MMSTTKQVLRWIAVLPGALIAGVIVMFPVHWAAMYIHHFGAGEPIITDEQGRGLLQSMPLESLERFGYALLVFGTIIAAGARIAPRFHFLTAIVLALCLVAAVSYGFTHVHIDDSAFRLIVTFLFNAVGLTIALFYARELDTRS